MSSDIRRRKRDHIEICLKGKTNPYENGCKPLDRYALPYCAFPDLNLSDISLSAQLFAELPQLQAPIMISSMTGGESHGRTINENIAQACEAEGIPFGLGSMRIIDRYPETLHTFNVKHLCPSVPMFANIGLVQMNYGFTPEKIAELIHKVNADGLCIHLNHLQEAVQTGGDTNFEQLDIKLRTLITHLRVSVIVKEVGHGIERESARKLQSCGVRLLDVSGTGGTSWAWIEGQRAIDENTGETDPASLGFLFRNVGIPLDKALMECRGVAGLDLIASGGLRHGVDVAKALILGQCKFAAAALPFLEPSLKSAEAVQKLIQDWKKQLRVAMFACDALDLDTLRDKSLGVIP